MAAIAESIAIGYTQAKLLGGMFVVSLLLATPPRRWLIPAALLLLLAVHPAWTVSAITGDCGFFKRQVAYLFTGLGVAALFWQIGRVVWNHFLRQGRGVGEEGVT
jgi:hypothetical protein